MTKNLSGSYGLQLAHCHGLLAGRQTRLEDTGLCGSVRAANVSHPHANCQLSCTPKTVSWNWEGEPFFLLQICNVPAEPLIILNELAKENVYRIDPGRGNQEESIFKGKLGRSEREKERDGRRLLQISF